MNDVPADERPMDEAPHQPGETGADPADAGFSEPMRRVLADPLVQAARDSGKPARLHKALLRKRKATSDPAELDAIDALLADRRLFMDPNFKLAGLGTWNGIGTCLYGRRDHDPDTGTCIATVWFTVLFIPVWPIGQYVVSDAAGGYRAFGRVPMAGFPSLMRRLVLVVLAAGLATAGFAIYRRMAFADVYVFNALDVPVTVEAAGRSVDVPARSRATCSVPVGRCRFTARTLEAGLIEQVDGDIPSMHDVVAYNILGAAPLISGDIIYYNKKQYTPSQVQENPGTERHYCGQRFVAIGKVSYAFTEPPENITMSDSSRSTETRTYVDLVEGGWALSARVLADDGDMAGALALATSVAKAQRGKAGSAAVAVGWAQAAGGPAQAADLAAEMVALTPDDMELHRTYQQCMLAAGRRDECLQQYRQRAADAPDSAEAAYLRARLEPLATALPLYADLAERFPDAACMYRGLGWCRYASGQFADALAAFEKGQQIVDRPAGSPHGLSDDAAWFPCMRAECLAATGKPAEAVRALAAKLDGSPGQLDMRQAVLFGRLLRLAPQAMAARKPDHYLRAMFAPKAVPAGYDCWFALVVGSHTVSDAHLREVEDAPTRTALEILRATDRDPEAALHLCQGADAGAVGQIDDQILFLLACEFGRRGDRGQAERLAKVAMVWQPGRAEAIAYAATGEIGDALGEMDVPMQAVVHFMQARRAQAARRPADEHLAKARAADFLHSIVTRAAANWPPATP